MKVFNALYTTFLDALFPIPEAERQILAMGAEPAWKTLPRAKNFPVPEACSIFSYKDERTRRLIWSIKYKKSAMGASIAGYALYRIVRLYAMAVSQIVIIPMPITSKRRRERGFNQCELLADELERLDVGKNMIIIRDLLLRKGHTSRQTLKDRAERLESIKDIFVVNEKTVQRIKNNESRIKDGTSTNKAMIIVIDDVVTTGSTIKDAVSTLRQAGFTRTWGLSVAH